MEITEISPAKNGRRVVSLEDGSSFPLYNREVTAYALRAGSEIAQESLEGIFRDVLLPRAKKRLMYLLQRQDRTEYQLRDKLRRDGYPETVADEAVSYVKSYHYVDDYRYACAYISSQQQTKSRNRIRAGLRQRGISAELIEQALEEVYETEEEELIARLLVRKKYDPETADYREKGRIYRFLAGRGFSSDAIRRVMEQQRNNCR
ncbi:MAG: recombination regulator RecX [Lachnospiraceae bacterium]|jgi:regulatory protein|nr:recombination regulator RecX [Lachnospiraceae bacterium]MCI1656761.1 recombination regulator RecX [Lachnospiraceae bacterium]MCI2195231.1 recombination regulator RecX [Lachnospiraceae bacterium]